MDAFNCITTRLHHLLGGGLTLYIIYSTTTTVVLHFSSRFNIAIIEYHS